MSSGSQGGRARDFGVRWAAKSLGGMGHEGAELPVLVPDSLDGLHLLSALTASRLWPRKVIHL